MRKAHLMLVVATLILVSVLTGCTRVGPGHVGIVVDMAGSNKGVLDKPVRTGWVFYNPVSESVYEYPTFMQTAKWTQNPNEGKAIDESITFTNKDSMTINADISLSYNLSPEKVPFFYVSFLATDEEDLGTKFTHGFLRNVARDCFNEHAGKYDIQQIMGDNAPFLKDTRACVQDQVAKYGVELQQFGFIGAPRPPQEVINSINMKVQAQQLAQQKQNELLQVQADAQKQVAAAKGEAEAQVTRANGEAEANRVRNAAITDKILEMRRLDNQHDAIWHWDGQMPNTVVNSGQGQGGGLLFNIPAVSK